MRRRRGIMGLNGGAGTPVITATATGNPLTFETDMVKPLKSLVIPFTPIQEGSGNPSPTNVRPISGWTGVNIYNEETYDASATPKLTINWQSSAGTIYGGPFTLNEDGSADLVSEFKAIDLGIYNWTADTASSNTHLFYVNGWDSLGITSVPGYCSILEPAAELTLSKWRGVTGENRIGKGSTRLYIKPMTVSTAADAKDLMNGQYLVAKLATPQTYHFDNVGQLIAFLGTNTIWTDTNGTNTATYLKHQS